MRVVFCGSPDFAIPSLEEVVKVHEVVGVFTQPDRIMGKRVTVPDVKKRASELSLPVYQFDSISKEGFETLASLRPDVIITCAFGQFLRRNVLDLAKYGVINVHASLLPLYRGAAPVQSAVLNGDKETGVSIMRTVYEMDAGDVILCEKTEIGDEETSGELFDRLSLIGAKALIKALDLLEKGEATFTPQDSEKATFCKKFDKEMGKADFSLPAETLRNMVRAFNPWPTLYTYLPDGNIFKIYSATVVDKKGAAGEVLDDDKTIVVACGDKALKLNVVQAGGGKRMSAEDYVNAHKLKGVILGE